MLCGGYRKKKELAWLSDKSYVLDSRGQKFFTKDEITCSDSGIYYISCKLCIDAKNTFTMGMLDKQRENFLPDFKNTDENTIWLKKLGLLKMLKKMRML